MVLDGDDAGNCKGNDTRNESNDDGDDGDELDACVAVLTTCWVACWFAVAIAVAIVIVIVGDFTVTVGATTATSDVDAGADVGTDDTEPYVRENHHRHHHIAVSCTRRNDADVSYYGLAGHLWSFLLRSCSSYCRSASAVPLTGTRNIETNQ